MDLHGNREIQGTAGKGVVVSLGGPVTGVPTPIEGYG